MHEHQLLRVGSQLLHSLIFVQIYTMYRIWHKIHFKCIKITPPYNIIYCHHEKIVNFVKDMNSMKTCPSVTFYFMKNSFSDISRKRILPNMIRAGTTLIIFGKIHFLLISENEFFMK